MYGRMDVCVYNRTYILNESDTIAIYIIETVNSEQVSAFQWTKGRLIASFCSGELPDTKSLFTLPLSLVTLQYQTCPLMPPLPPSQ